MMNWIQHVIPEIKAKDRPLVQRMDACLPYFQEAALSNNRFRNLGGWMFSSINEYKYAKPFMAALAEHMKTKLSQDEVNDILSEVPELQYDHFRKPLLDLKAILTNDHDAIESRKALAEELGRLFIKRPHDVGHIFNLALRYDKMEYRLKETVACIENNLSNEASNAILSVYRSQHQPTKSMRP